MTAIARYLSHPEVRIDPDVPVPEWGLSETGHVRVRNLIASGALAGTTCVVSSAETKAMETAKPIAASLGCPVEVRDRMHENDRSATGFLPPDAFEAVANRFFAHPTESIRGWERAVDAQTRIVAEVEDVLIRHARGDVLFVGHGGVGTLLHCHLAGVPISRRHDQIAGGGCFHAFEIAGRKARHGWKRMEEMKA